MKKLFLLFIIIAIATSIQSKRQPTPVYIVAGQSNTDGRVPNKELPRYIQTDSYKHCYWIYGSGTHSGEGKFELFRPRIYNKNLPGRWAYDAVTYYWLEKSLDRDFYVIKESLGGTAIDTKAKSNGGMYWSAAPSFLDSTTATDKGGKSLLKAFTENIGACIDSVLSKQKGGYEIMAFIWHQGESDRSQVGHYYKNLRDVIGYVRTYLVKKTGKKEYANLPVIIGSIAHNSRGFSQSVEDAQMRLSQKDRNVHLVDVHDATLRSDNIHFDATGAELLGRKIYNELVVLGLAGENAQQIPFRQHSKKIDVSRDGESYMFVDLPDSAKEPAPTIIAIPGGGYAHAAMAKEGTGWTKFFNAQCIAYISLMYRMPNGNRNTPISDAENAIRIVRDSAKVWNIDSNKVGIMGSSAGGHLASTIATHADSTSLPDFQILFYPVITMVKDTHNGSKAKFLGKDKDDENIARLYSNELQVKKGKTPPALILLASDDIVVPPLTNGIAYYESLLKANIPAALFCYPTGGHGFGSDKSFKYHQQMLTDISAWLNLNICIDTRQEVTKKRDAIHYGKHPA